MAKKSVRRKNSADILPETKFKWKKLNLKKQIKKIKWPLGTSKKGCLKGKGGPRNLSHRFRGVRQRLCGKWVAKIREPKCSEVEDYVPKKLWLGTFGNEIDAARTYDQAAKAIYGILRFLIFQRVIGMVFGGVGVMWGVLGRFMRV